MAYRIGIVAHHCNYHVRINRGGGGALTVVVYMYLTVIHSHLCDENEILLIIVTSVVF